MSNLAKMRPNMTSRTRSYLTNQRSCRLEIFRTSGEKLEMQLCKKVSSPSQTVWGLAKKNHLGMTPLSLRPSPPPPQVRARVKHLHFGQDHNTTDRWTTPLTQRQAMRDLPSTATQASQPCNYCNTVGISSHSVKSNECL